jgi:acyltransferase
MNNTERISWIDHCKALGIVLVVVGHTAGLPALAVNLIYSFHMPLFFFISGYLLKDRHLQMNLVGYLRRLWRKLLLPYLCFWIISYLYWLATRNLVLNPAKYANVTFWDLLSGLLYGTGDLQHTLYIINVDLWFFTCLFSTALLFYFVQRIKPTVIRLAVILLMGAVFPFIPELLGRRLPWNIELAGAAIVFYGLGYLLKNKAFPSKTIMGLGMALALPFWIISTLKNTPVDMNAMQFGSIGLFYPGAIAGIYLVIASSHFMGYSGLTRWLALNTMIIFPLHQLMFSVFTGVGVRLFGFPSDYKISLLASLVFTALAFLCSVPIAYILRRYTPFIIGEPRLSTFSK